MKKSNLFLAILTIIIFVNLPFWSSFTNENYCYQNLDKSFEICENGGIGSSFVGCVRAYGLFLGKHPEKDQGDNKLYRTFTIKPWKFWQWREYIFHSDRFRLPYLDTDKNK